MNNYDNTNNFIDVFQKTWAFTSSESANPMIRTGMFGPCYTVTFTASKFAAMAHIDDNTDVDSIKVIFNRFSDQSIELKDVTVVIIGGWEHWPESFNWGEKVVKLIKSSGFEKICTKNMFSKQSPYEYQLQNMSPEEASTYYHTGAVVDSRNGKTFLLNEFDVILMEKEEARKIKFMNDYDLSVELPITEIQSPKELGLRQRKISTNAPLMHELKFEGYFEKKQEDLCPCPCPKLCLIQ